MRQRELFLDSWPVGWWLLVAATIVISVAWLLLVTLALGDSPAAKVPSLNSPDSVTGRGGPARSERLVADASTFKDAAESAERRGFLLPIPPGPHKEPDSCLRC
jgi:hypothetical protein